MFGATYIRQNSDKSKRVYTGYGTVLVGGDSLSFGSDFARNIVIFGVDNTSWSHADNCKNNFLLLSDSPTYDDNDVLGQQRKKFSINFSKAETEFSLILHYNGDNIICLPAEINQQV